MGACYSVLFKVGFKNEEGAIAALNEHMDKDTRSCYALTKYANFGITPTTFDGLMRILLAELQHEVSIWRKGKFIYYSNDFDASYGWEGVMMEWFDTLAPYLCNGSRLLIYPDSDYDELVIKNGKCVQIH